MKIDNENDKQGDKNHHKMTLNHQERSFQEDLKLNLRLLSSDFMLWGCTDGAADAESASGSTVFMFIQYIYLLIYSGSV